MCWSEEVWTAKHVIFSIFLLHQNELLTRVIEMLSTCCTGEHSAADFHPTDEETGVGSSGMKRASGGESIPLEHVGLF